jgi:Ca2+-binding RTX toxin-like protein
VDSASDNVVEASAQGNDLVQSSVSFALPDNVEHLQLIGRRNIDGTGNSLANVISGNSGRNEIGGNRGKDQLEGGRGADTLDGGGGRDTLDGGDGRDILDGGRGHDLLTGGTGHDFFVFSAKAKQGHADTITDFDSGHDTIVLSHHVFRAMAKGALTDADFAYATDADATSARVVYDGATGDLFYDADGAAGSAGDVRIATLSAGLALATDNFLVV